MNEKQIFLAFLFDFQRKVELEILKTPSGEERNRLTELNILLGTIMLES